MCMDTRKVSKRVVSRVTNNVASLACRAVFEVVIYPARRDLAHREKPCKEACNRTHKQCLVVSSMMLSSHGSWCSGRSGRVLVSCPISDTERVTSGNKLLVAAVAPTAGELHEELASLDRGQVS